MIASRPLVPGDVVVTCEPFCHILAPENWSNKCFNCYESGDQLKRCSRCQVFLYCSRECQAKDWKDFHKHGECDVYRKVTARKVTSPAQLLKQDTGLGIQFALRLYLLLTAKPELKSKKFAVHGDVSRSFDDLDRNSEQIAASEGGDLIRRIQSFVDIVIIPLVPDVDRQLFTQCIEKSSGNCFGICATKSFAGPTVAKVMYIELSAFNHSCCANASHGSHGQRMSVRVMESIDAGQEINISFIDPQIPKHIRLEILKKQFNRTCECQLCQSGDDAKKEELVMEMTRLCQQMQQMDALYLMTRDFALTRKVYLLMKRELDLFRQIYGNIYRLDHTVRMYKLLETALRIRPEKQDHEFLQNFMKEIDDHWKVTIGYEHPLHEKLLYMTSMLETNIWMVEKYGQ